MQASFFIPAVFGLTLASVGLALPVSAQADPAIPLLECREQSIDQPGFDECLTLLAQQSVTALSNMEARWIDKLSLPQGEGLQPVVDVSATEIVRDTDSATGDSGQVIAIVSADADVETPAGARVINIDNDTAFNDKSLENENANSALQALRFPDLLASFQGYRDQRCEWEAGLLGADRARGYLLACEIALNRQKTSQLRQLLIEKNAADVGGESFQGFYVATASGGSFQSCDRRQDWWVTGTDEVLDALQRRYDDIAAENLEMVYTELRGTTGGPADDGPGADFVGSVQVATINLMRPILERDCRTVPVEFPVAPVEDNADDFSDIDSDNTDSQVVSIPAVTVDDLGDAGFLYGYFSNWMSACAVDNLTVCQAQTQAEYSSEGEWMVSVDRSSQRGWRVRLIPTTENHLISGPLGLTIDAIENTVANVSVAEIEVGRGVTVASGQRARELVTRLRVGESLDVEWVRPDQVGAKVSFSLTGITRSLQYFNQAEK